MLNLLLLWRYPQCLFRLPQAQRSVGYPSLPRVASISGSTRVYIFLNHSPELPPSVVCPVLLLSLSALFFGSNIWALKLASPQQPQSTNPLPKEEELVLHLLPELTYITQMVGHKCFPPTARLVRINCPSTIPTIKALPCPFYVLLGGNLAHVACCLVVGEVNPTSNFLHHSSSALAHGFHLTLSIQPLVVKL
eukprot:Gb_28469 [translate_table: standard]